MRLKPVFTCGLALAAVVVLTAAGPAGERSRAGAVRVSDRGRTSRSAVRPVSHSTGIQHATHHGYYVPYGPAGHGAVECDACRPERPSCCDCFWRTILWWRHHRGHHDCDECDACQGERYPRYACCCGHCYEYLSRFFDGDLRQKLCKLGYFFPSGCGGAGCPPVGCYGIAYEHNPYHVDLRDTRLFSAQGYGVPMGVPLAPNVEHTYNYGWGVPSSRLTPISRLAFPRVPPYRFPSVFER